MVDLGAELRRRRKALGVTLEELSERACLSPHYLSTLENGRRAPRFSTICALAEALRVPLGELFSEMGGPESQRAAFPKLEALFERAPRDAQDAILVLLRLAVRRDHKPSRR